MHRSFAAGSPQAIDAVRTIADSLGAPYAAPYSFGLCRRFVDELVLVTTTQLRARHGAAVRARPSWRSSPPAPRPPPPSAVRCASACAASASALIVCGANIDPATFAAQIAAGAAQAREEA